MPTAFSLGRRECVIDAVESGVSRRCGADVFKVSVSTVTGGIQQRQISGGRRPDTRTYA